MNKTFIYIAMAFLLVSVNVWAAPGSQYNMSLQDKVIGETSFASLNSGLKAFDQALGR